MLTDYWPLVQLRLVTPRLELRVPTDEELGDLADLAGEGVHDPAVMPFTVPWTDLPPIERGRSVLQWAWRQRSEWTPESWCLALGVFLDGRIVGMQDLRGRDFAVVREVATGSWLGLAHHGQGIGTEMRAAVLELAFSGISATVATSAAFEDNPASYRVSERLGYLDDGLETLQVRGTAARSRRLRLSRERWLEHRTTAVTIDGLERCLPMFGV